MEKLRHARACILCLVLLAFFTSLSCAAAALRCYPADADCNSCISASEANAFIDRWKVNSSDVTLKEIIGAVRFWKRGCAETCSFSSYTPTVLCNNNGVCEGIENEANCANDCPGYSVSPESKKSIERIWSNLKQLQINHLNTDFAKGDTYVIYDIQSNTKNLLEYAYNSNDYGMIDSIIDVYTVAYGYLEDRDSYTYGYLPGKSQYTVLPLNRTMKMWIDRTALNASGQPYELEDRLSSSQFIYAVSRTIDIIAGMEPAKRTQKMKDFVNSYRTVALDDHYERWVFGNPGCWQVRGWGCSIGTFNHYDFLSRKYNLSFGDLTYHKYCNAVTDVDMWVIAGVVEMLAANSKDPSLVPINSENKSRFLNYTSLATKLLKSRMTESNLTNFQGAQTKGINFDLGMWEDYADRAYCGYTGDTYPTENDKATCISGWDISHASRFVSVFNTLYRNRAVTNQTFPDKQTMVKLINQVMYGTFNKDFERPLFTNYMDGTNGWHRVGYNDRVGFGIQPYGTAGSIATGGYGLWSEYNTDMYKVMNAYRSVILSSYVNDNSGNGLDAESKWANWTSSGKRCGAYEFTDNDTYVDCGSYGEFSSEKGSVEFWIKTSTPRRYSGILNIYEDNTGNYFFVRMDDNKIRLVIKQDSITRTDIKSEFTMENNTWNLITITQDGAGSKIYVNGYLFGATGTNSGYWANFSINGCWIGKGYSYKFNGTLDEVRVYNRSLSAHEVTQHYYNEYSNNSGLVAYWNFDQEPDEGRLQFLDAYYSGRNFNNYTLTDSERDYGKSDSLSLLKFLTSLSTKV